MGRIKHEEQDMPFLLKITSIGVFGGFFWGVIWYLAYFFNFTEVGPALIWLAWSTGDWGVQWLGQWTAVAILAFASIGTAFLYRLLFARFQSIWAGLMFGAGIWFFVFYLLNPLFIGLQSFARLENITLITTFCLFILYGLFIGYSVSYEYGLQKISERS